MACFVESPQNIYLKKYIEKMWYMKETDPYFKPELEKLFPSKTATIIIDKGLNYRYVINGHEYEVCGSHILGRRKEECDLYKQGIVNTYGIEITTLAYNLIFKENIYTSENKVFNLSNNLKHLEKAFDYTSFKQGLDFVEGFLIAVLAVIN